MRLAGEAQAELIKLAAIGAAVVVAGVMIKRSIDGMGAKVPAMPSLADLRKSAYDAVIVPVVNSPIQAAAQVSPVSGSNVGVVAGAYLALEKLALDAGERIRQFWQN